MALKSTPKPAAAPAPVVPENKEAATAQSAVVVTEAPAQSKAVAKRSAKSSALAVVSTDYLAEHANEGFEEAGREDVSMPYLKILQGLSPEVTKRTVEGAAPGMFLFTATNELYNDGARFVPCYYKRVAIEYKPEREGFVAVHEVDSAAHKSAVRKGKADVLPNGNEIEVTAQWFGMIETELGWKQTVMSLSRTQLKHSRKFLTLTASQRMETSAGKAFCPPLRTFIYTLRTAEEANEKNAWSVLTVDAKPTPTTEVPGLFDEATNFYGVVRGGDVKVSPPVDNDGPAPAASGSSSQSAEETF